MALKPETVPDVNPEDSDSSDDEMHEIMFAQRGCCNWIPIFSSGRKSKTSGSLIGWERIANSSPEKEEESRSWWSKGITAFMKLREWSELVAGPKWKTFIRRFNKNRGCCGGSGGGRNCKFQYDPLSYALNFDDGQGHNGQFDSDRVFRDFSSRYAAIPASAKSSMDLGRDAPSFT